MSKYDKSNTTDERARHTRNALARAIIQLSSEKDIDKITVKELTDCAGVARSTFYTHYSSLSDYFVSSFSGMLARGAMRGQAERNDMVLSTRYILEHMHGSRKHAASMKNSRERLKMLAAGEVRLRLVANDNLRILAPYLADQKRQSLSIFIVGGFMGILRYWLETGMRESPEAIRNEFESFALLVMEKHGKL